MESASSGLLTGLNHLHSALRWVILILLIFAVLRYLIGWVGKHRFGKGDDRLKLFTMIFAHVQLLVGLGLYFLSPAVQFGENTMKYAAQRFWTVEHFATMLVAIVLITLAHSRSKRLTDDVKKHRLVGILFTLALILIFSAIPWPWREAGIARPYF